MPVDRSAFITSQPLPNVAFDHFLEENTFIARDAFTVLPVPKGTTKVSQIDASKLRPIDDSKGTNSEPNLVDVRNRTNPLQRRTRCRNRAP